ncbi:MAG TPA: fumarylacetoacetate hydrolase family protein [Nocardioidaceae bacterium]|nr:fumarylacetoacetate hydrolase family protein [Nocardioidaceae bacterium]
MKLATIRTPEGTRAVRVDGTTLTDLDARDVREVLEREDWQQSAAEAGGQTWDLADADFAPLVPEPSKVLCVGLNYRNHILEMGRDLPEHPTLFNKYADTLIGARDEIHRPAETEKFDWEAELTVVIGKPVRRVIGADAEAAIAGFTVLNDVTCRDWQFRTREWLQGKNWDSTTPVGPFLVTPDELPGGVRPSLSISCEVDGELMQKDSTADLLFDPVALVEYVSTMIRLNPGDLIATGTPGGVGHARKPEVYLSAGQKVVTEIEGVGRLENTVVADPA